MLEHPSNLRGFILSPSKLCAVKQIVVKTNTKAFFCIPVILKPVRLPKYTLK